MSNIPYSFFGPFHEILNCNGVDSKLPFPAKQGEPLLSDDDRAKSLDIFPNLADGFGKLRI